MKRLIFFAAILLSAIYCRAQTTLVFPFQGGREIFDRFFKDSTVISPDIIQKRATGTVVFKFTADENGTIGKIIIYYADDASLTSPLIDVLRKSNHKWIIPDHEKVHDFIISFKISFNAAGVDQQETAKAAFEFYRNRRAIQATDQIPLDEVSLLPVVNVVYDFK